MADSTPLPPVLPIFPLTGAVLLPGGQLPLNIFEPRYLAMVKNVKAQDGLIGMVQPRRNTVGGPPPVEPIGCAGKITQYEETPDNRILIVLEGVQRFRISSELTVLTPYRQVAADWTAYDDLGTDPVLGALRDRVVAALKAYLAVRGLSADWAAMAHAPDRVLVNQLSMLCPFAAEEKQALLEAPALPDRAKLLETLLAFGAANRAGDQSPPMN